MPVVTQMTLMTQTPDDHLATKSPPASFLAEPRAPFSPMIKRREDRHLRHQRHLDPEAQSPCGLPRPEIPVLDDGQ
jgi:hypothetical protein